MQGHIIDDLETVKMAVSEQHSSESRSGQRSHENYEYDDLRTMMAGEVTKTTFPSTLDLYAQ